MLKKYLKLHFPHEVKTYVVLFFAIITTIIAIKYFLYLVDNSHKIFLNFFQDNPNIFFILTPIIYLSILYLVKYKIPFVASSGIPQTIASIKSNNKLLRNKLLNFNIAVIKIFFISIATLFGAPLGVGGPSVHIGASIFFAFANLIKIKRKVLINNFIATGAGLALMIAFHSPLAGISFAFEEIYRYSKKRLIMLSILLIAIVFVIKNTYNAQIYLTEINTQILANELWVLPIIIIISTIIAALFVKLSLTLLNKLKSYNKTQFLISVLILGLCVAIFNFLANGLTSGGGRDEVLAILSGENLGGEFLILKLSIIFTSLVSAIPGGILIPSITIGASIGDIIIHFFNHNSQFLIIMSMISYLSAISRTPIFATFIVLEMTNALYLFIPAILIAFISNYISSKIQKEVLFYELAKNFNYAKS